MEQVLPARFAAAAIQHEEVAALAQAAVEDFLAHDVPGVGDVHPDKDDRNDLSLGVFYGLVLGDVALAKQQRQSTVDFTFADGRKGRAGGIQNGTHGAVAVLFAQGGGNANKVVTAANKQRGDCSRTIQEVIRKSRVFMQFSVSAFQQRNGEPVYGPCLLRIDAKRLGQKCRKQPGIAFDFLAQAGIKHLHHINHAGGLIVQIFDRKGFKLLAGFLAEQESEQQKQRGDADARQQR